MADALGGAPASHSNLYVRNLPAEFDQTAVECMFRQFGTIVGCKFFKTASVPYAFIKLGTVEEAQKALAGLNGTVIMGRSVLVKAADADAQYDSPNENLYVRNAPLHWNEESIRQHFSVFGTVLSVKLLPMQNHSKALAAMVRMGTVEAAEEAKNACNAVVPPGGEMALNVKYADTPEEKARKAQSKITKVLGAPGNRYAPYPMAGGGGPMGGPMMGMMGDPMNGGGPPGMLGGGMGVGMMRGFGGVPIGPMGHPPEMLLVAAPGPMGGGYMAQQPQAMPVPAQLQQQVAYPLYAAQPAAAPQQPFQQQQPPQQQYQPPQQPSYQPQQQYQPQQPPPYQQQQQPPPAGFSGGPAYPYPGSGEYAAGAQGGPQYSQYQQPAAADPGAYYNQQQHSYQPYGPAPPVVQQAGPAAASYQQPYDAPGPGVVPPLPGPGSASAVAAPNGVPSTAGAPAASTSAKARPASISVRNLSASSNRLQLYEHFAPFGATLSVAMHQPGQATIQYADGASAMRAVQQMNNTVVGEHTVQVMLVP